MRRMMEKTNMRAALPAATLGGLLLLNTAACGSGDASPQATVTVTAPSEQHSDTEPTTPTHTSTPKHISRLIVKFSARGGGSNEIMVYPGVNKSKHDTTYNGTFEAGTPGKDTAMSDCITEGRSVSTHPEVGEEPDTSTQWVHLTGEPTHYANLVYLNEESRAQAPLLPNC